MQKGWCPGLALPLPLPLPEPPQSPPAPQSPPPEPSCPALLACPGLPWFALACFALCLLPLPWPCPCPCPCPLPWALSRVFFVVGAGTHLDCSPGRKQDAARGSLPGEFSSTPAPLYSLLLPVCRSWLGFPVLLLWLGSTATLPSTSLSSDGSLVALQCGLPVGVPVVVVGSAALGA